MDYAFLSHQDAVKSLKEIIISQLRVLHCSKYFEGKKHPAPKTTFDVIFVTSFANDQNNVIARAIMYPGSSVSGTDADSSPYFEVLESSVAKTNFPNALTNLWDKLQVSIQENKLLKFAKGEIKLDDEEV